MFDFTLKELQEKVREVASDYPKYVYKPTGGECTYFRKGENDGYSCPDCIIGHALHRLGVTIEDIKNNNIVSVRGLCRAYLPLSLSDDRTLEWLAEVQDRQDLGMPWAKAVKKADEVTAWMS